MGIWFENHWKYKYIFFSKIKLSKMVITTWKLPSSKVFPAQRAFYSHGCSVCPPGHKAFRSQLTANELWGLKIAGRCRAWVVHRTTQISPLWQPRPLAIWGRYLSTKIPHLMCRATQYSRYILEIHCQMLSKLCIFERVLYMFIKGSEPKICNSRADNFWSTEVTSPLP